MNLNTSTVAEQRRQGHGQTAALGPARLPPCPTCSPPLEPEPAARRRAPRPTGRWPTGCGRKSLAELVGQEQLLRPEAPLARMLERGRLASLILWGPPGCGKTTLARLLAKEVGEPLMALSAVMAGVADLRKSFEEARKQRARGRRPILFIDEIHRFNRTQQDGLLHEVEDGTVTLIGATTENPSFALTPALISRCHVLVLERLPEAALLTLLERAEAALGHALPLDAAARARLAELADGDGRYLLNLVETIADLPPEPVLDPAALAELLQRRLPVYDKGQEAHYNLISALHKSVRGSDPDAALYWLTRMLQGGEDPRYLARRLVRMAVEDIGLADPQALVLTRAAAETYRAAGLARGRAGAGAGDALSGAGAQVERGLPRLWRRPALGQGARFAAAAAAHPERADPADEAAGLRQGLRLRPRRAGPVLRPGLLPGRHGAAALLRADRRGIRGRAAGAADAVGRAAPSPRRGERRMSDVIDWLLDGAPGAQRPPDVLDQLCRRLIDERLPAGSGCRVRPCPAPAIRGLLHPLAARPTNRGAARTL